MPQVGPLVLDQGFSAIVYRVAGCDDVYALLRASNWGSRSGSILDVFWLRMAREYVVAMPPSIYTYPLPKQIDK